MPSKGDVVFSCLPFAHILFPTLKGKRCDFCFSPSWGNELILCPKCCLMSYCSQPCLESDWDEFHQIECKYPQKLLKHHHLCTQDEPKETIDLTTNLIAGLVSRIVIKLSLKPEEALRKYQLPDGRYVNYNDLRSTQVGDEVVNYAQFTECFADVKIGGKPVERRNIEIATRIALRYLIYLPLIVDKNDFCGMAFCVQLAFVGHSCLPNSCLAYNFEKRTIQVRAFKEFALFSQLRVDFEFVANPKRLRNLLRRGIQCDCGLCKPTEADAQIVNCLSMYQRCVEIANRHNLGTFCDESPTFTMFDLDNFLRIYNGYHPHLTTMLIPQIRVSYNRKRFQEALSLCLQVLEAAKVSHGDDHPLLPTIICIQIDCLFKLQDSRIPSSSEVNHEICRTILTAAIKDVKFEVVLDYEKIFNQMRKVGRIDLRTQEVTNGTGKKKS